MTPEQNAAQVARERALLLAEQDLHAIALLFDSPGWAYLERRLHELRQQTRDEIADNDLLTDAKTRELRVRVKTLTEILRLPATDRMLHASTIELGKAQRSGPSRG